MNYIKLIFIGFLLTIPTSIFAADISVSSPGTVVSGETITLTIAVNNVTDLFSTAFYIQYDPAVISFVSAQKGTFLEQGGGTTTLLTSANNGVLIVGYSRQAVGGVSTGVNGSGNIMTLTFNALSNGTSNITFLNNSLCSSVGFVCTEIPASWSNTTVTVSESGAIADITAPSIPANLSATAISTSQINLSWSPSTDSTGVTGYRIYRNGAQLTTTTGTSYSNTGLSPLTLYIYTVSAYDEAGNDSSQSTSASATTQAQAQTQTITDGTAPIISSFSIPSTSTSLAVTVSSFTATDTQGVTGYKITETSSAPVSSDTGWSSTAPTTYVFTNAGSKNLYAWAKDSAGNISTGVQASVLITLPTTTPTQTTSNNNTPTPVTTQQNTIITNTNTAPAQSNTGTQTITTIPSNTTAQPTLMAGCSFGFAFSITTGKPCGSTTTTSMGGTTPASPTISSSASATATYLFSNERPIIYGMKNSNDVRELQKILQKEGLLGGASPVDGSFFLDTKNAVIKFQQKYGIFPAEGFVGPITKKKINELYGGTAITSTPAPTTTLSSFFFSRSLTIGSRGEDVQKLQQILNVDPSTKIAQTGAGSPGNETTYFGPATQNAVIRYQQKYGITPSIGFVGPLTRNKLNGN
ncbi:MAG: hypothetical protein A3B07_00495 [Candidatus Yonathbacteria bacterium RIFCSPLOWO2_01_FULL_43_27]|uniref:Fibronectin type-III domain-containing protein n=1 Tax=Candidatus Yonathbacteria bacterium RIFCSPLOWO2_01_FULL_43_27 TaxID=1802726 RepID=A0A1G2SEX8_9BACT|nr:MAG: hypothetical protein A2658_00845 [Candidatus Yonathbacteria bacterium RIFCSPHIGHO2_01_FULL_44_19]OHA83232.1 MAG: hypothetical protein A3B07_00495 [Candidatus Yonathbacteria bacterium RIFCSPLOWO2_01_FULL_43_27]